MPKSPEFYDNFLIALFRRGRAEVLPKEYLDKQASRVLKDDEMPDYEKALQTAVADGRITQSDEGYTYPGLDPLPPELKPLRPGM